mmetsp:Transcript_57457/g.166312  ORF Transcript_57457/g.166312 Transcript_57457/m.166312 type:complete len:203 (-) Transcript_57457:1178-1786(-)
MNTGNSCTVFRTMRRVPILLSCAMCFATKTCILVKSSCITSKSFSTLSKPSTDFVCKVSLRPNALSEQVRSLFVDSNRSLAMAGPCIFMRPSTKEFVEIDPVPSSKMSKTSGNSSTSMSNNFIVRVKLMSSNTRSNSLAETVPFPSWSRSSNILISIFRSLICSSSFLLAMASSSFLGRSKSALLTTIAVIKLNKTMPVMPM